MSSDVVDGRGDLSVGKFILVAEKHQVYRSEHDCNTFRLPCVWLRSCGFVLKSELRSLSRERDTFSCTCVGRMLALLVGVMCVDARGGV